MKTSTQIAQVALSFEDMDVAQLLTEADGTVTGLTATSTTFSALPIPLATITTQTTALRGTATQITAGNKSVTLTRQQTQQANTLMRSLIANGHYVEDTANRIAAGNVTMAEGLITSAGYKLAKAKTPHKRAFEIVKTGIGWAHVRAAKARKGNEGHIWRYGITTAKNVAPAALITRFNLEADIILTDLPSNIIIGVQHASILPVGRKAGTSPATGGGISTPIPASTAKHSVFSNSASDPYTWTDFIYTVIP
jgi:hypothetical protein